MICLIVIVILVIPSQVKQNYFGKNETKKIHFLNFNSSTQVEQLAVIYIENQKRATSYSRHRAENEKHVVVCCSSLQGGYIMDFLNEFYAHPMLQNFFVVLLSPNDLDQHLSMVLQIPIWSQRVIFIQGSALNNSDLNRAQVERAEACFILAARNYHDRQSADEHSILRSWAIKDYAPNIVQYVHLLKPENKMHVQHASKHV